MTPKIANETRHDNGLHIATTAAGVEIVMYADRHWADDVVAAVNAAREAGHLLTFSGFDIAGGCRSILRRHGFSGA